MLAAYPASTAERLDELVLAGGIVGLLVLLPSLAFGWTSGVAWSLAILAGDYALALSLRDDDLIDAAAPLYGAGLLALAELAYWSLELRGPGREEPRVAIRRATALGAVIVLSAVVGSFVVVVTASPFGGGLAWDAVGVAAAACTLAILAWLARRRVQL
jgi:hypothetical protein